jgi:hypothetical protein
MTAFDPRPEEDENTDAINENTEALRDFSREFRNLPSNYKVEGAIFSASQAVRPPQMQLTIPGRFRF